MIALFKSLALIIWMFVSFGLSFLVGLVRPLNPANNRMSFRVFGWGARQLGLRIEYQSPEGLLDQMAPCICVPNHQSGLDMAVFGRLYPARGVTVVKRELGWMPIYGWALALGGNIMIRRSNHAGAVAQMQEVGRRIRNQNLVVGVFAEGTRNRGDGWTLNPYKKGAFYMAMQAQVPLIPFAVEAYDRVGKMEDLSFHGGRVRVKALDPILPGQITPENVEQIRAQTQAKVQAQLDLWKRDLTS